jgi:hypothetical protein
VKRRRPLLGVSVGFQGIHDDVQAPAEKRLGVIENARVADNAIRGAACAESSVRPLRSAGRATTREDTEVSWRRAREADIVYSVLEGREVKGQGRMCYVVGEPKFKRAVWQELVKQTTVARFGRYIP